MSGLTVTISVYGNDDELLLSESCGDEVEYYLDNYITLKAIVSGGGSSLSYLWSDSSTGDETTFQLLALGENTYTVSVSESESSEPTTCEVTIKVLPFVAQVEVFHATFSEIIACGSEFYAYGGAMNIVPVILLPSETNTNTVVNEIELDDDTLYVVTVTNAATNNSSSCEITEIYSRLIVSLDITEDGNTHNYSCSSRLGPYLLFELGTEINVQAVVSGISGLYEYSWSIPDSGNVSNVNITVTDTLTSYSVTVTDTVYDYSNFCRLYIAGYIQLQLDTNFEPPTIDDGETIYVYFDPDNQITATPAGGIAPYTYAWILPDGSEYTTATVPAIQYGTYEVTVKDDSDDSNPQEITYTFEIVRRYDPVTLVHFSIDEQPVACGGLYIKFCDLSARIYNTNNCRVSYSANIATNEADILNYLIIVNGSVIRTGEVTVVDQFASTPLFDLVLTTTHTMICVRFSREEFVAECCSFIQRLNSNIVFPGCNN